MPVSWPKPAFDSSENDLLSATLKPLQDQLESSFRSYQQTAQDTLTTLTDQARQAAAPITSGLPDPSSIFGRDEPERPASTQQPPADPWAIPNPLALFGEPEPAPDSRTSQTPAPSEVAGSTPAAPVRAPGGRPAAMPQASAQPEPTRSTPSAPTGGGLRLHAEAMASKYGVPWDVFDRQLNQESGYRTDAVSSAGASGPGQFMPATGNAVARQMGVTPEQFWASPELQVEGAALHMRDLMVANGGDIRMALAAYNAGQGNVDKYGEGVFGDDFAAGQTRDYVDIILGPGSSQRRGRVSMTAGAAPAPAAPPPSAEPAAGAGLSPGAGSGSPASDSTALWSPVAPADTQAAYQMGTGRNAGGVMLRAPNVPTPGDTFETELPVMGPGDGGYAPEPPAIDPSEGGVRSPAAATVMPIEEMEQAPEPLGPSLPTTPAIQAIESARAEPEELAPRPTPSLPERVRAALDPIVQQAEALPGPFVGAPNPVAVARGIFENTKPAAGAPDKLARLHEIRAKAAQDQGRTDGRAMFSDDAVADPTWAAANPALVEEYDQILSELSLDVGGMAGEAPRIGRVAGQVVENMAPTAPLGEAIQRGREAIEDVGTRVTEGFREGRRVAAELNARPQRGTVAPGTFGVVTGADEYLPRPRVVPPEVADTLDFPVRVPTDPGVIRAIEAAGGTVDERGVTLGVTRAQSPTAAGGVATRGGVFYEAIPEGGRSSFVTGADNPNAVGGTQALPRTMTRFRSPLILDAPPGDSAGFDSAMRQLGANGIPDEIGVQNARETLEHAQGVLARRQRAGVDPADIERAQMQVQDAERALERELNPPLNNWQVERAIREARDAGPEGSPERAQALKDVVSRYGGDPSLIDDLLAIRGADASESAWAIKENILSHHARRQGYDGVVTVEAVRPDFNDVNAHPKVVAALAAKEDAWKAISAAQTRGNYDEVTAAERAYTDASYAYEDARSVAQDELASSRISELTDVREGRNPTPGAPNPLIAEMQGYLDEALETDLAAQRHYQTVTNPLFDSGRTEADVLAFPEARAARDAMIAATQQRLKWQRALDQLKAQPDLPPSPGGYTLREDIRRRDPGSTTAQATAGMASRAGSDVLARINADIGSALGSSTFGAAAGAALPADSDEERRQNALRGAGIGLVAGPAASRLIRSRGGALATFGVVPDSGSRAPTRRYYHGTGQTFDEFDVNNPQTWLTANPEDANFYAQMGAARSGATGANVRAVDVPSDLNLIDAQDPYVRELRAQSLAEARRTSPDAIVAMRVSKQRMVDQLMAEGYEGLRAKTGLQDQLVIFPNALRRLGNATSDAPTSGSTTTFGTFGMVPDPEVRIPRAGYATDLSEGAETMVRQASDANAPQETVSRAEVARKAQEIIGADPDMAQRWQDEALGEAPDTRAVRGEALRQAEYIDAENANRALDRLREAQRIAREAGDPTSLAEGDKLDVADALIEAAEASRAFQRSAAASTAEGRATARALAQRRSAILSRQAFQNAARARQVGQDAAFAAQAVQRAARTGTLTDDAAARLRVVRDKLAEADRHGLGVDDGAGGRLDALEQRTAAAQAPMQQARTAAARAGQGLGTRIATEVGTGIAGSTAGVTTGLATGQIEDQDDLRAWAAGGAAAALGARHLARRSRGTLATLGAVPDPSPRPKLGPGETFAFGAKPGERIKFRVKVVPLSDLVTSHTDSLSINQGFPSELQPRVRERAASQIQIDRIVQTFDPDQLLTDTHRVDSGPMIVGADNVVESGNGRSIALRRLAREDPEKYAQYIASLREELPRYGLSEDALRGIDQPVLVRERVTPMTPAERAKYAADANVGIQARMAPVEQAMQDAGRIPDDAVARIVVGEDQTIDEALMAAENGAFRRAYMATVPEAEWGELLTADGNLNPRGLARVKEALLTKTYQGSAGARLATAFVDSLDSGIKNVQHGIMGSLPTLARVEARIAAGEIDPSLSIANDMATAADVYSRLRRRKTILKDYLAQSGMFEGRETTPFQDRILGYIDENARAPKRIRALLDEYAKTVDGMVAGDQTDMFGLPTQQMTKDEVLGDVLRRLGAGDGADTGADLGRVGAGSDILEGAEPGRVTVPEPTTGTQASRGGGSPVIDIPAAPVRRPAAAPAVARPGTLPDEILPATGGPEGRLSVEGAPEPVTRPGAPPEAPRGGPEGTLRQQVVGDRSVPAGAAIDAPAGGPEGSLTSGTNAPLRTLDRDARVWMQRALRDTNNGALDQEFRASVDALANHSPRGRKAALDLLARHDAALSEQSTKLLGDVEKRLADDARKATRQQANEIEQSRIRGVVAQIDQVLANPQAPGSVERLQQLHADLTEISQRGFTRSSEIRARLQRNGLLRAGMASKTEDVDGLVKALARVDPDDPGQMRAVLNIISKPRLIDKILEYQYVNMLSSPITQAVNISSNAMQIAGRLLLQNPLEFAYSGGRSGGVRAGVEGAVRGFREALPEAGEIMRTGVGRRDIDRAIEIGDYGHINREALTEQFGKAGALLHVISTRPLQAMDALLGHTAYASAAEQLAQRKADDLLRSGSQAVKGMTPQQARQHVLANIWDYPEVVEQAGKIEEYTLLRSKGDSALEQRLRGLASLRTAPEDAGFGRQVTAFIANQILPFFNVPLNFAKQGAERSFGAPVNLARGLAERDPTRRAELLAKGTIGAAALTTAGVLAATDNLTGDGPSDPGRRAVWEQTHKRNSFRVPGTDTWLTWEGTPFAIPFGMVAGMREGAGEALERSAKKGQTDAVDVAGSAAIKTVQGASSAFLSQSFVRGLADQYKLLTGQDVSMAGQSASAASTVSRFLPGSGMLNFLARISDDMERDLGRPQTVSEMPENIAGRVGARIPGIPGVIEGPRQRLDPKLDIYGEPAPNEQSGAAGILPYFRGVGARAGDPITQRLDAAGVGAIEAPQEVPAGVTEGVPIPLSMREKRVFQQAAGQAWRRMLEGNDVQAFSPAALERLRSQARQAGVVAALAAIDPAERQRRVQASLKRKAG